ncbi:MAG: OmpA family protein, partial [Proteobacteria bacterium]
MKKFLILGSLVVFTAACATGENKNAMNKAGIGAGIGAVVGGVIGHQTGRRNE